MRVVLDCNVLVSAGIKDGFVRHVVRSVIEQHDILVSPAILAEYERVAGYDKFSAAAAAYIRTLAGQLSEVGTTVNPASSGFALPDPDDVLYVDAAIGGDAPVIVTGNLKHFPAREYGAVKVLSVREFATLVGIDG